MTRWLRAGAVAIAALVLAAVGVSASPLNAPTVSVLSPYVVNPGGQLTISGNHFSDDATGTCDTVGGTPQVHFQPLNGAPEVVVGPNNCSNTQLTVTIPPLGTSARVVVSDASGHVSTQSPQVTLQPQGSLNRSAGGVDSGPVNVVVSNNLLPPNIVGGSTSLSYGGARLGFSGLANSGLTFSPPNATGEVVITFQVCDNGDDNCAKRDTVTVDAGRYTFLPPTMSSASVGPNVVGDLIKLPGQNLGSAFGSVSFAGSANGSVNTWSPTAIGVTIPAGAQPGAVTVSVPGYGPSVAGPAISLNPKATGLSPASGSAGQQVQVTGYNFQPSGMAAGSVSVGGASAPVAGWSDRTVAFTISSDSDGGAVSITRADGAAAAVSNLAIVPRLDRVETPSVMAGSQVVVDGVSFGANQGKATLGAQDVEPLLWSRQSVLVQVPTVIAPGTYPLTLTAADGAASNPLNVTIIPAPSPTPGAKPGATPNRSPTGAPLGIAGALAPSFDNNHDFVKPIKPPSPVYFNVTTDPHSVKAGQEASVTVTLKLNDKPVKGAEVKLAMLFTPGSDYRFTPDSGVTDENGVFTAKVRVSKTPGDSVIAATSGVFSDQDHVTGAGADGKAVAASHAAPTSNGGFAPLLVVGVVALVLVGAGFYLNVRSMGS